jgi:hydrogenase/urease accessory protein HupE
MQHGLSRAATGASIFVPGTAFAHPGHGGDHGFVHDLEHLLAGLDPVLVILLVCATGIAFGFGIALVARRGRSSSLRS